MPKKNPELRINFLREFTLELIKNTQPPTPQPLALTIQKPESHPPLTIKPLAPSMMRAPRSQLQPPRPFPPQLQAPGGAYAQGAPPHQTPQGFAPAQPLAKPVQFRPPSPSNNAPTSVFFKIEKVNPMLNDPSVVSIECPGPDKPILVNRSGAIQPSSILLTKEEISNILEEISEKTKIPIISGVFKAAFNNLLVTAVVSELVGSRFIIQKRNPFQRY